VCAQRTIWRSFTHLWNNTDYILEAVLYFVTDSHVSLNTHYSNEGAIVSRRHSADILQKEVGLQFLIDCTLVYPSQPV